ncbi:hypothetical protein [Phreatobacter oligotrophus]|jgi:hypothetical protein|uniref:Uncharacterized protein n=1 Tax=Phreatobacter oligotrophus TaxID=1122261 RepID=A0A2T4YZA5_9HYPH|nr:hypothetical protein [Phreatobacter oligotrophus]PTM52318.1 hypothetical protein C8P69_108118 [Phreatobacter oligotrophus]
MTQIVNGYRCENCTDVSNAKRGLDPENPTHDPLKQEKLDRERGRVPEPAVTFTGRLAGLVRDEAPAGPVARLLDISA